MFASVQATFMFIILCGCIEIARVVLRLFASSCEFSAIQWIDDLYRLYRSTTHVHIHTHTHTHARAHIYKIN